MEDIGYQFANGLSSWAGAILGIAHMGASAVTFDLSGVRSGWHSLASGMYNAFAFTDPTSGIGNGIYNAKHGYKPDWSHNAWNTVILGHAHDSLTNAVSLGSEKLAEVTGDPDAAGKVQRMLAAAKAANDQGIGLDRALAEAGISKRGLKSASYASGAYVSHQMGNLTKNGTALTRQVLRQNPELAQAVHSASKSSRFYNDFKSKPHFFSQNQALMMALTAHNGEQGYTDQTTSMAPMRAQGMLWKAEHTRTPVNQNLTQQGGALIGTT